MMAWVMVIYRSKIQTSGFLKMAYEYSKPPYNRTLGVPAAYNWQSLTSLRGGELEVHYSITLRELGKECLNQDLQDLGIDRIIYYGC
jgi:hypothetical protein